MDMGLPSLLSSRQRKQLVRPMDRSKRIGRNVRFHNPNGSWQSEAQSNVFGVTQSSHWNEHGKPLLTACHAQRITEVKPASMHSRGQLRQSTGQLLQQQDQMSESK